MKVSYAITVKDEFEELIQLLKILQNRGSYDYEIVIVYDSINGSKKVEEYLRAQTVNTVPFRWYPFSFEGDFSKLKNYLTAQCTGDFIFQLDADEYPNERLLEHLPTLLQEPELIFIPRWNTIKGITKEHIEKWNWKQDDKGRINWPDHQGRIYRNRLGIEWKGRVHERIQGHRSYSVLEDEHEMYLIHPKTIERQEKQNKLYCTYG